MLDCCISVCVALAKLWEIEHKILGQSTFIAEVLYALKHNCVNGYEKNADFA
jgi:hypothetical protein